MSVATHHYPELKQILFDAGAILAERQRDSVSELKKSNGSITTNCDLDSQRQLVSDLHKLFPTLPFLLEEREFFSTEDSSISLLDASDENKSLTSNYISLDPADGTVFLATENSPNFAISIGIVINGRPVAGAIYQPLNGTYFDMNNVGSISPIADAKLDDSLIGIDLCRSVPRDFRRNVIYKLVDRCRYPENLPSVISGSHLLSKITRIWVSSQASNWDIAATAALVEASGGVAHALTKKHDEYCLSEIDWRKVKVAPVLFAASESLANQALDAINS